MVSVPMMWWPKSDRQREVLALAASLADVFATRAEAHDRDGTFPHENVADLRRAGYLGLTVPRAFGGGGLSVLEATLAQERLARGDGSTALGTGMHLSILGRIGNAVLAGNRADAGGWERDRYARVVRAVVEEGALLNSAASEPETGSPSRGGRPATRAVRESDGRFRIDGRKTYTTMGPALRFFMVSATIEPGAGGGDGHTPTNGEINRGEAAQFLLEAGTPGLRIEETWDSVGMRATGSHDLVLEGVRVPETAILTRRPYATPPSSSNAGSEGAPAEPSSVQVAPSPPAPAPAATPSTPPTATVPSDGPGWALLIPAVYLGIATAARDEALRFARDRRPEPLGGKSIGDLPAVQRLLGEIEIALAEARALLFGVAEAWSEAPAQRPTLLPLLAAAKYVATNRAVEITDKAMRVVGGAGLARSHPVQRYYRDVRAGLHHPPMDDVALTILAREALARVENATQP